MNATQNLHALMDELECSLVRLDQARGHDLVEILRPIILRRRRAVSMLRAVLRNHWPPFPAAPAQATADPPMTIDDICHAEGELLEMYDAALAASIDDYRLHALLSEQRSETEQAYLYLHARTSGTLAGSRKPVQSPSSGSHR